MSTIEELEKVRQQMRELYTKEKEIERQLNSETKQSEYEWLLTAMHSTVDRSYFDGSAVSVYCSELVKPPRSYVATTSARGYIEFGLTIHVPAVCVLNVVGKIDERRNTIAGSPLKLFPKMTTSDFIFKANNLADPNAIARWLYQHGVRLSQEAQTVHFMGQIIDYMQLLSNKSS